MQFHITQIRYILILIASISLIGCEKNVTVEIPKADEQIVVEGYIETGQYPFVILSKTLPFFGSINTSTTSLLANTVTGALITLNDGTTIDTLNQLAGIDYGIYSTARMRGEVGRFTWFCLGTFN